MNRSRAEHRGYDLLIFDLDGTLVDTAPDIAASANWAMRQAGYPERSLAEIKHAIGRGVHELLRQISSLPAPASGSVGLKEGALEGDELERACDAYREHYTRNLMVHSRVFEGVREMLTGPLAQTPKAIVTNKPHPMTLRLLAELDLERHFDPVIGTGWQYSAKPSAEGADAARARHGASAGRTILIGDSEVDRQTAANAGIQFGWVSYGYDTVTRDGSFRVFENPYQWEELIDGNV